MRPEFSHLENWNLLFDVIAIFRPFLKSSIPGVNSQNMPFTLDELVTISLRLKEVSLGLVELAFPESRPSVREDYRTAVSTLNDHPLVSPTTRDTQMWAHLFKVKYIK